MFTAAVAGKSGCRRMEGYAKSQKSGIRDEHLNELIVPAAFRRTRRDGKPHGIVKVVRS